MTTETIPFADIAEIKELCESAIKHNAYLAPSLIAKINAKEYKLIQNNYNGAGPDSFSRSKRKILTRMLRRYRVPVMGHDWRYTKIKILKQVLQVQYKKEIMLSEYDLLGILHDWIFLFPDSRTQHFLDEWETQIFTEEHYTKLLECLWHDSNMEFYINMKLYEFSKWIYPIWCYSRFKTSTAYKLTESAKGWSAWCA